MPSGGEHVETGEWLNLQAVGEFPQLPVELVGRVSPTLALSLKCRGQASPSRANWHPPLASPLPRDQSESLSSTHCTPGPQNPAGSLCLEESRWNTPISSQRRHGAIWPRSSKVKAKLRSGVQVLGKCTVEERGMLEP